MGGLGTAFHRFLQHAAGDGAGGDDDDYTLLVERLVQRVSEAVLLPDRREALQQLRDLLAGGSPRAQLAFGTVGLPVALGVVRDREDVEMVQLALESLAAAVGGGGGDAGQAAAINAQQLARAPDGLPVLLSLLEAGPGGVSDFYARYHTLQVLKGLAAAAPLQLQEAILGAPLGMTRLMDLLGEQEVLRNEALLLLTHLAGGSADLQKIAAFEGAFDRLFGIVREEGLLDGDIVVQDCFQLMAALLRGSPPNQLMFRETGLLAQMPALLRLPEEGGPGGGAGKGGLGGLGSSLNSLAGGGAEGGGRRELTPQKAGNLVAALEVVLALLPPVAAPPTAPVCASAAENRQALLQRGLLDVLVALALQGGGVADDGVRAQALLCLAAVVGGSRLQQDQLAALSVKALAGSAQPTVPLLQQVLHAAVAGDCPAEQVAADRLLEAFCLGNPAGQSALVGPLLHSSPPAAAPGSFAGLLLQGLGQQGSLGALAASSRAAAALSHLVASNASVQPHLLGVQVAVQQQQQQPRSPQAAGAVALSGNVGLMGLCASHLGALVTQHGRQPASLAAAADTLRLLLVWLHACPPAVTAFLRAVAQSQPFLVDSIRGSNACSSAAASAHPLTRGMLALLLGLCASYAEEGAGTASQQQLLGAICQQIGQPQFLGILDALLQHPAVSGAGGTTSSAGSGSVFGAAPAPSPAFAAFLRELAAEVRQRVTGVAAPPQQHPAAVAPPAPAPTPLQPPPTHLQPPAFHGAPPGANGVPPYSGPHHHKPASPLAVGSPRFLPPGTAASAATPASASPWQPASPRAQPASVPMFSSATAAATALHGHLPAAHGPGTPGALPSSPTPSDMSTQLQLAHARAEALQRENQQLRAEQALLNERLRSQASAAASAAGAQDGAAGALRQQLEAAQEQLAEAAAAAERARGDAQAAQAAARKLETDLEDLSAAYSTLDVHAGGLQQRLEQLEGELAQQRAAGGGSGAAGGPGGASPEELERRLAEARAEGQAEAQAEGDEAMGDLLVCLGQEEAKVARLRERLEALGVDCDALLADIVAAGEEEGGEGGGEPDLT